MTRRAKAQVDDQANGETPPPDLLPVHGEGKKRGEPVFLTLAEGEGHIEQVVFDISGVTARDFLAYRKGISAQIKLFMRVIRQWPAAWGDPLDEATWRMGPGTFQRLIQLRRKFTAQLEASKAASLPGLRFDMATVSVNEVDGLDEDRAPAVMAKYCTHAPDYWEHPVTADTFLDLPQGVYLKAQEIFFEAVNDLGKN